MAIQYESQLVLRVLGRLGFKQTGGDKGGNTTLFSDVYKQGITVTAKYKEMNHGAINRLASELETKQVLLKSEFLELLKDEMASKKERRGVATRKSVKVNSSPSLTPGATVLATYSVVEVVKRAFELHIKVGEEVTVFGPYDSAEDAALASVEHIDKLSMPVT